MVACVDRRDRLDKAIVEMAADSVFTPVVTRLGCLRGVSTFRVRVGCRNRRLATPQRALDRRLPRVGAHREFLRGDPFPRRGHQNRQRPRPPIAGRSSLASPSTIPARRRALPDCFLSRAIVFRCAAPDFLSRFSCSTAGGIGGAACAMKAKCAWFGCPSPACSLDWQQEQWEAWRWAFS